MITDLKWFASVIELLANGNMKSNEQKSIERVIGANINIWLLSKFKEKLAEKQLAPVEMVNLIFIYHFISKHP